MPQIRKYTYSPPPFHFARPKSLQCSLSWDNGTVRFLLHTVRAKVIYASRQKSERHFEARSIKRVLRLSKRRTNLTGVPWDDRDNVGVFWELAWGAIIPDRRKKKYRRHRVLASIRDILSWMDEIEAYNYLLCQRGINTFFLQMLPTLGRRLVKVNILVCGFCM